MENNSFLIPATNAAIEVFMDNEFYYIPQIKIEDYDYIGDYNKRILFIVDEDFSEIATTQFARICSFAKLYKKDFALLNAGNYPTKDLATLVKDFKPIKILLFGSRLGESIKKDKVYINDGIKIYAAAKLNELWENIELKKLQTPHIMNLFS